MLKNTNTLLVFILVFLMIAVFHLATNKDNLISTTWICDQKKTGFIFDSFSKYNQVSEKMILTFSSKDRFFINELIQVQGNDEDVKLMELYYDGDYLQKRDHLTLKFESVQIQKKHDDINLNRAYKEYEGHSILYRYKNINNRLYFYTDSENESFDMVCYKNK
ncbi:hypothetical protein SKA34_19855 [Photobacterium sp. SKA34]|uniref:hypothetical protein n=1 Tax=Photobacterium sp. SKA34 TaxID=121723 RepID=UPI00006ACD2C|nr:hypothetical protein [Photobacterium sp. SKA34]EAR56436.1 hypothetical protein SKA34_19855 [Photobacterium sp. SKA34]